MRTILAVLTFGLLSVGQAAIHPSPTASRDSVRSVAKSALSAFLEMVPVGQEIRHGFPDRSAFARATVGDPIPVYGARPAIADSLPDATDSVWDRPVPTGVWRVPILLDGKARTFLTVESVGGTLQAVEIGGASLAQEIGALESSHPGKRKGLLRLDRLRSDVLMLDRPEGDFSEGQYVALRSSRQSLSMDSLDKRSRRDMFRSIHKSLRTQRSGSHAEPKENR